MPKSRASGDHSKRVGDVKMNHTNGGRSQQKGSMGTEPKGRKITNAGGSPGYRLNQGNNKPT